MNARLENLINNEQQEQTTANNVHELIEKLSKAIRTENIADKHNAIRQLLSTDAGKEAVTKLLEDNDPKKIKDVESVEYFQAARFSREIRKAINHIDPSYVVDEPTVTRLTAHNKVGTVTKILAESVIGKETTNAR